MGRSVRRVPKDWVHPVYTAETARHPGDVGRYVPLLDRFDPEEARLWDEGARKWAEGLRPDGLDENGQDIWVVPSEEFPLSYRSPEVTWEAWTGTRPDPARHMPFWPDEERTHIAMYETTSEGTPISPVFKTGVALAHWLADNNASCFGDNTASYETWLTWIREDGVVDTDEDIAEEMAEVEGSSPAWAI
jgi:hypothetical protein